MKIPTTEKIDVQKITNGKVSLQKDLLAIEEPVEIQLAYYNEDQIVKKSISITMRTPGNDFDLAIGFLITEGIITNVKEINKIEHPPSWNKLSEHNAVLIHLKKGVNLDLKKLERHFYTSSSCGVCGKSSIEAIYTTTENTLALGQPVFEQSIIYQLQKSLRSKQSIFEDTGGLHAAALVNQQGEITLLREDVGRHNAVDKLIGAAAQKGLLPLSQYLILVSGRASFELIQKTWMAGIPILAAVGAPSSLAIQLAKKSGMTVLGFVKADRFNIYCHENRIT